MAKSGDFRSLLSNQGIIVPTVPHCSWGGDVEEGGGTEPDKGRQRSWRKTAYATHAWIAAHRFHLLIYLFFKDPKARH